MRLSNHIPVRPIVATVTAAVLVAACGGGGGGAAPDTATTDATAGEALEATYDGPDIELSFWNGFTGGDGPVMRDLVEQFSEEHDNITVTMEVQEWADYYEAVPAAVGTGSGPDIGIMHIDTLATNAARNVIKPLDNMVEVLELDESDFSEPVWNAGVFDGQRYGVPLDVHPLGFYYNKTLMEEAGLDPESPPTDMESYMAALQALQDAGIQGSWVSPHLFTGGLMYQSLLWQFGGELYDEDGNAAWNSPEGVAALEWMVSLVEDGHSPTDVGQDADHIAFMNNENAFIWNGIWMINAYGEDPELDWGVAPLPVIGDQPGVWAGSHNFVLMEGNDDPNIEQAALVFFSWVLEHSLDWAAGGQVPAANQVREDPALQDLDYVPTFAEQLPDTNFPPSVPGIGDAQGFLATAVNEAVLGEKSPQQALDDAAAAANEVLEENRQRFGE